MNPEFPASEHFIANVVLPAARLIGPTVFAPVPVYVLGAVSIDADVVGVALACAVAVAAIEGVATVLDAGAVVGVVVGVAVGVLVVHPLTAITMANSTKTIVIEIGL